MVEYQHLFDKVAGDSSPAFLSSHVCWGLIILAFGITGLSVNLAELVNHSHHLKSLPSWLKAEGSGRWTMMGRCGGQPRGE